MANEAKVPEIKGPFRKPEELNAAMKQAREAGCIVLSPLFYVSRIVPNHAVDLKLVLLDAADPKNSDDVWLLQDDDDGRRSAAVNDQTEVILTRVANDRIAAAGGVRWKATECGREDDHSDPYYIHYKMTGEIQTFDGDYRDVVGDRELDYRDGSATVRGWTPRRLERARKSILALAVSMASNNAIRRAFSMPSSFPLAQARKYFVVPKLVVDSDERWVQEMQVARSLSAQGALYPPSRPLPPLGMAPEGPTPKPKLAKGGLLDEPPPGYGGPSFD